MFKPHTEKQLKYFDEVIRMHYELGYGEDRISNILPVGHSTVNRWIAIFAKNNGNIANIMGKKGNKEQSSQSVEPKAVTKEELAERIAELERKLRMAELRADVYDEMINVAESKFNINIRKKAGAKQ